MPRGKDFRSTAQPGATGALFKSGKKLRWRHNPCSPVPLESKEVPAVLRHEIVGIRFMGQAEKLHVRDISRQTGRNMCTPWVDGGPRGQVQNEAKNLVIRSAVTSRICGKRRTVSN